MAVAHKPLPIIILLGLLALLLLLSRQQDWLGKSNRDIESAGSVNRDPARLVYSKHARCRMGCRQIDESEVREILQQGTVNAAKSEPGAPRDPKYALEGTTHDGQQVRIIYAMAPTKTVVVTVIDLGQDIECSCL